MNLTLALWYLGRGTGVVALVLLTVTVVLGILNRSGRAPSSLGRTGVYEVHRTVSLTAVLLLVVHVGSLLLDPYAQLRLVGVVVPFDSGYRPLWVGFGTMALDLMAAVTVTALLRHRIGPRAFTLVHRMAYALWPLALVHGLGAGTDAKHAWLWLLAAACVVPVVGAVGWRLSASYAERGQVRRPRERPTTPRREPRSPDRRVAHQ